jgi:peptidoglycan/xylan/chitin deacetylase (PgdA/CDA1 family)
MDLPLTSNKKFTDAIFILFMTIVCYFVIWKVIAINKYKPNNYSVKLKESHTIFCEPHTSRNVPITKSNENYQTLKTHLVISTSSSSIKSTLNATVITYHHVRPYTKTDKWSSRPYITVPESFEKEMKYLYDNNFNVISVDTFVHGLKIGSLPKKSVVLTFDDGYKDQYEYALPVLMKYHFPATFFIYTNAIEGYGDFMTWDQVRSLLTQGMTIAVHTESHAALTKIKNADKLRHEISGSKRTLEEKTGTKMQYFAYPYGLHNHTVESVVKDSGFEAAFGLVPGNIHSVKDMFSIHRYNLGSSFQAFITSLPSDTSDN